MDNFLDFVLPSSEVGFFWYGILATGILSLILRYVFRIKWARATFVAAIIIGLIIAMQGFRYDGMKMFRFWELYVFVGIPFIPYALISIFDMHGINNKINSDERRRTLEMIEQGKITAEEGTELLEALGRSNALLGQDKFSRLDMLIIAGISITVLGFFLPWNEIHSGIYQSGQHFGAEGWAILIIAVLAAVPVFVTPKDLLYKTSMLQVFLLLLDCALIISLIVRVGSRLGPGLPVCLIGFTLALVACYKKFKSLAL